MQACRQAGARHGRLAANNLCVFPSLPSLPLRPRSKNNFFVVFFLFFTFQLAMVSVAFLISSERRLLTLCLRCRTLLACVRRPLLAPPTAAPAQREGPALNTLVAPLALPPPHTHWWLAPLLPLCSHAVPLLHRHLPRLCHLPAGLVSAPASQPASPPAGQQPTNQPARRQRSAQPSWPGRHARRPSPLKACRPPCPPPVARLAGSSRR